MHDITKLLKQIQESQNLTNYGLAKAVGVSPQYLYRFLKEPFLINPTIASKIAVCSNVDPLEEMPKKFQIYFLARILESIRISNFLKQPSLKP